MKNMQILKNWNFQKTSDRLIGKYFLKYIPHSVTPNQVTLLRFALIPAIYLLLVTGNLWLGLVVFIFAAWTDALDGAMARTRDQITDLGKVIDPIADKLLIVSALAYIGLRFWIIKVFVLFIIFEIIAVTLGYMMTSVIGKPIGANVFGKIKLILQSFGVGLFILAVLVNSDLLINVELYALITALVFAILAGLEVARRKLLQISDL